MNTGFVAYSPYDTTFRNCTFRDNNSTFAYDQTESLSPGDYRYAGGLTLAWRNRLTRPVAVLIKDCVFINNTASINANNTNDTNRPNFYVPRGHGGALIASFNNTQNHTVLIEDTVMTDNAARYNGGGVFVSFYNQSNWNQLIINRTRIERNSCNNVGGAISMNTFEIANFNYLIVEGTNFTDNRAWAGGGACTINHQVSALHQVGFCLVLQFLAYLSVCCYRTTGSQPLTILSNQLTMLGCSRTASFRTIPLQLEEVQ